jgi:hypothetical protein
LEGEKDKVMGDRALIVFHKSKTDFSPCIFMRWRGSEVWNLLKEGQGWLAAFDPAYSAAAFCGFCCKDGLEYTMRLRIWNGPRDYAEATSEEFSPADAGVFLVDTATGEVEAHHGYGWNGQASEGSYDLQPRVLEELKAEAERKLKPDGTPHEIEGWASRRRARILSLPEAVQDESDYKVVLQHYIPDGGKTFKGLQRLMAENCVRIAMEVASTRDPESYSGAVAVAAAIRREYELPGAYPPPEEKPKRLHW